MSPFGRRIAPIRIDEPGLAHRGAVGLAAVQSLVILALAAVGFGVGYALAPEHHATGTATTRSQPPAPVRGDSAVAIPVPAASPGLPALVIPGHRPSQVTLPATGVAGPAPSGASQPRSSAPQPSTTKKSSTPKTPTSSNQGTTTDPFNGQSHQQPSDSSTGDSGQTSP
jgi:hypothetical protein